MVLECIGEYQPIARAARVIPFPPPENARGLCACRLRNAERISNVVRVAIAHDFLCQRGGAERVVLHLASILNDAFIATSVYSPEATYPEFASMDVRAGRLASKKEARRFRSRVLSYPHMFSSLDLSEADFVVVSSSAFAHHVRHERSVVYWHTPPRFLYDPAAYLPFRASSAVTTLSTGIAKAVLYPLRRSDRRSAAHHLSHAANSKRTAGKLRAAYGVDPVVLHPPLDLERLSRPLSPLPSLPRALVVSRLLPYKGVDVAIAACRQLGLPLTVVGSGPEEDRLRMLGGSLTTFKGMLSDEELVDVFLSHSVVLCPGVEDFGYVPLEAGYCGRPVVGLLGSGAAESVIAGQTGELVDGWEPGLWSAAIDEVLGRSWDPERLRSAAERFGPAGFNAGFAEWISEWVDPSEVLTREALAGITSTSKPDSPGLDMPAPDPGRALEC